MNCKPVSATKACTKCGEVKPSDLFARAAVCLQCRNAARRAKYAASEEEREKARVRREVWTKNNLEKARALSKAWAAANPEKVRARVEAWAAANPEKVRKNKRGVNHRQVANVSASYAAGKLGIPAADLSPELHETYREHLLNKRVMRELTTTLKELTS